MRLRLSIMKKFVFAFLMLSILPLCVLGYTTLHNLRAVGRKAIDSSTAQLEKRARESLELRSIELANRVAQTLNSCESDLLTLVMLPRRSDAYRQFSWNHRKTIWTREGTNDNPVEVHVQVPLYSGLAFIGPDGRERVRISEDRIVKHSELRDVSKPENTTYKSERYFQEAKKLKAGEIYVSHVTGWFVTRKEQLGKARHIEDAVEGSKYRGVVRFATPCYGENGELEGVVVLSLDHRHLMELTLHVLPTRERFVVFPVYSSGNYAFMFDDDGWIITHPKYSDIRGVQPDGKVFNASDPSYTREKLLVGEVPFNLGHVDFINPNYGYILRQVRLGHSGVTSTFNVGGTPRVMAYAPIFFNSPPYNRYGIFGGITIGVETAKFQEPALLTGAKIDEMVAKTKQGSLVILGITALLAVLLAIGLARTFTRPIFYLAGKARDIAAGHIPDDVAVRTGDELELLAQNFADMAREIQEHQESLEQSLAELAQSKKSVEQYSHELEKQLRVLKNVHYLSQYLSTVYDRELVLQTVLKTCVEGLGYDRVILYLYDHPSRRLVCHRVFGFSARDEERAMAASYDIDRHDCIPTRVFATGETIFVKDIHAEERATPLDLRIAEVGETDFFVYTPVKSRDRVIGILGADTKTSRREIKEIDVESLQILANYAARAMERSELYERLVAEKNSINSIISHMTSGIVTLDEGGRVSWFNPYSEKVFQIKGEDALGKHYGEVFAALPSWVEVIDNYLSSRKNEARSLEHHSVFKNGEEKILEVHFSTIPHEKHQHNTHLLFVRDVTQRKRMEEHIGRSDRLVSLGVLAAGIAHEMRNPLTGISLLMDDLHDKLGAKPRERELIQRSLQEIDRLENLINGLLDFAVPSRGVNLEVRPFGNVLQNTLFLVKKLCKNQGVSLSVHTEEDLPLLNIDPEKLQQAVLNLLLNAIQAMPEGGQLNIEVKKVASEESLLSEPAVRIVVSDTGRGIAAEDIPFIFDPFFSRTPSGCGLGLAIVHGIVQEHKGRISVSSQLVKGTSFRVDLPAVMGA
jgi:PAS domain S-box-containing protein